MKSTKGLNLTCKQCRIIGWHCFECWMYKSAKERVDARKIANRKESKGLTNGL